MYRNIQRLGEGLVEGLGISGFLFVCFFAVVTGLSLSNRYQKHLKLSQVETSKS